MLATDADLKSFLTARRSRLRPEDVGLRSTHRRRVPGLRREDVAELVGVSVRWYSAFEAGKRNRHFSAAFVHRIADALRLNATDRVWLFRLALPEAAVVAEHFEIALSRSEDSLLEAQATAGRALASSIFWHLVRREALHESGVKVRTYDALGEALLWAFEEELGPAFEGDVREAWSGAYRAICRVMTEAAEI